MYNELGAKKKFRVFMTFGFAPLVAFSCVVLIPFLFGLFSTFTDWRGLSSTFRFVGIENYKDALTDPQFWVSMKLTFTYVLWVLLLTNVLALLLALLVTSGFRKQNFFRASFFTPNLIGGVILGFIWVFIFSRVFVFIGKTLNFELFASSWLSNANQAMWALIVVSVWQLSGYMMLIYIAGLTAIPDTVIEAARIDGADAWRTFLRIKLPLMLPSFTISIFLTLQRAFMTFDTNLSLTKGAPYRSTELLAMHIYYDAFKFQNYGTAQAKAILFFVIVALITLLQVTILKKKEVDAL